MSRVLVKTVDCVYSFIVVSRNKEYVGVGAKSNHPPRSPQPLFLLVPPVPSAENVMLLSRRIAGRESWVIVEYVLRIIPIRS